MGGVGSVGERPLSAASPRDTQALQSAIPEKPAQVLPESAWGSQWFSDRSSHSTAAHYRAASCWSS